MVVMEKLRAANDNIKGIERVKDALDEIDFNVLKDVFDELIVKKCRVDLGSDTGSIVKRGFVGGDSIQPFLSERNKEGHSDAIATTWNEIVNRPGEYSTLEPRIDINSSHKIFKDTRHPAFATVLKSIVHEEVHSTQFQGSLIDEGDYHVSLIGIEESVTCDLGSDENEFVYEDKILNEGLVEIIADRVTEEYLRRTGKTELIDVFFRTYGSGRMLVELLTHKIAGETGVPRETVLDGLIRDSYKGISLLHGEILSQMSESTADFLHRYKSLDIGETDEQYEARVAELCKEYAAALDVDNTKDKAILATLKKHGLA